MVVGLPDSLPIKKAKELGLQTLELPLNSCHPRELLACYKAIDDICRDFRPDVVNCHRGESFFLWALKKRKYKFTLIKTRGDQRLPVNNLFNRYLHKNLCDAIISTNTKMTRHFASLGIDKNNLYTVLGGVDTQKFYPDETKRQELRAEHGFTENDVVLGLLGRLDPVKGFHEAIQVFASICQKERQENKKKINKLHLVVAGGDCNYTMQNLYEYGLGLGIEKDRLHCLGYVENMPNTMRMLDAGIIASLSSETVARVAFEMIACHTPIIGSDVGVMPDILPSEYLFSPMDFERMKILFVSLEDKKFRDDLRQICVARLEGKGENENTVFGWSFHHFVEKTLKIYGECKK